MSAVPGLTRAHVEAWWLRTAWLQVGQRIERSAPTPSDVAFSFTALLTPARVGAGRGRRGRRTGARSSVGGWEESVSDAFDPLDPVGELERPPFRWPWPWPWPEADDPLAALPCGDLPWGPCAGLVGVAGDAGRGPARIVDELDPEDLDFGPERSLSEVEPSEVGIEVSDAFTACERELVRWMWGALRQNVDLVEWAMCMSPNATDEERQCLREVLTGVQPPITIAPQDDDDDCLTQRGALWGMKARGRMITICTRSGAPFARATELWCGCTDPTARACAVFSMATTLLHEVSHTCDWSHSDQERDDTGIRKRCQEVYLLQQSFAYAVFQRYPEAAASRCCEGWANTFPGIGRPGAACACDRPVTSDPFDLQVPVRRVEVG